jgi:hypothetical protein
MIPGAIIKLGGTEYTVPPINLRIDFDYKDAIAVVCQPEGEVAFGDYVKAASAILFALVQRNYPDMTREQFSDLVELPMLRPIINGMLHISGYVARPLAQTVASASLPPEPVSSDSSTPLRHPRPIDVARRGRSFGGMEGSATAAMDGGGVSRHRRDEGNPGERCRVRCNGG